MVCRVPSYYKEFRCIADKCPDNCCRGWEIDIDEDTLDYYKDLKGPMAEKIRASISEDGSFVLNEEGWCPLLNEKGLCEVCLTLGLQRSIRKQEKKFCAFPVEKSEELSFQIQKRSDLMSRSSRRTMMNMSGRMEMASLQRNSNQ